jgi:hypothetical protein
MVIEVRHVTVFLAFCDIAASSETAKDAQKIPLHLEVLLIGHCIIAIVTVLKYFLSQIILLLRNWLHTVAYTDGKYRYLLKVSTFISVLRIWDKHPGTRVLIFMHSGSRI